MSCYFMVDTYIDAKKGRGEYDAYIAAVKPIVESYGGVYLVRSDEVEPLGPGRAPQRVIVIRFESRADLDACFASPEYRAIMAKRARSVDARAVIVEGCVE